MTGMRSGATPTTGGSPREGAADLLLLIEEAAGLLEEESRCLLTGAYAALAAITERKLALLARLEQALPAARGDRHCAAALARLVDLSRRTERLLEAAREGLAQARRRLTALAEHRDGLIAYSEDGTRIACRPTGPDHERTA